MGGYWILKFHEYSVCSTNLTKKRLHHTPKKPISLFTSSLSGHFPLSVANGGFSINYCPSGGWNSKSPPANPMTAGLDMDQQSLAGKHATTLTFSPLGVWNTTKACRVNCHVNGDLMLVT